MLDQSEAHTKQNQIMASLIKYGGKLKKAFNSNIPRRVDLASPPHLTYTDSFSWLLESGVKLLIHIKESQFRDLITLVDNLRPDAESISRLRLHVYPLAYASQTMRGSFVQHGNLTILQTPDDISASDV